MDDGATDLKDLSSNDRPTFDRTTQKITLGLGLIAVDSEKLQGLWVGLAGKELTQGLLKQLIIFIDGGEEGEARPELQSVNFPKYGGSRPCFVRADCSDTLSEAGSKDWVLDVSPSFVEVSDSVFVGHGAPT